MVQLRSSCNQEEGSLLISWCLSEASYHCGRVVVRVKEALPFHFVPHKSHGRQVDSIDVFYTKNEESCTGAMPSTNAKVYAVCTVESLFQSYCLCIDVYLFDLVLAYNLDQRMWEKDWKAHIDQPPSVQVLGGLQSSPRFSSLGTGMHTKIQRVLSHICRPEPNGEQNPCIQRTIEDYATLERRWQVPAREY